MIKSAALAFVAGFASISAAMADDGITNSLLKNTYQQTANISCASYGTGCYINFPATSAVMTEITNISCLLFPLQNGVQIIDARLANNEATGGPAFYVPTFVTGGDSAGFAVAINAPVKLFFQQNQSPFFTIDFFNESPPASLTCTISGYHSQ